jgi:hypothetical protein
VFLASANAFSLLFVDSADFASVSDSCPALEVAIDFSRFYY